MINIQKGTLISAQKVVIYGPEGIGKSTFASKFPDPVFIDTEGSTKKLNVARFYPGLVNSWSMITDAVEYARNHPDEVKTLVIDTADWTDALCAKEVCRRNKVEGIEDIGYGKGYTYMAELFKELLINCETCIQAGINVVFTAHAKMRKFEQPDEMGAYDRWEMKLSKQTAPLLKEWADMVLFANYKTYIVEDSKTKSKKAQGGKRVMYTQHHPCWDAKNRDGLEMEIPFDYEQIRPIIENKNSKRTKNKPEKEVKRENKEFETAVQEKPIKEPEEVSYSYAELKRMMDEAHITNDEVKAACVQKKFQPESLEVWEYPEDFIEEALIKKWSGFSRFINNNIKEIPFIKHWEED